MTSVESGRCGPCCSVEPVGSIATRPSATASWVSGQVISSYNVLDVMIRPRVSPIYRRYYAFSIVTTSPLPLARSFVRQSVRSLKSPLSYVLAELRLKTRNLRDLRGIVPALATVMNKDGSIDEQGIRS